MSAVPDAVFRLLWIALVAVVVAPSLKQIGEATLMRLAILALRHVRPVLLDRAGWLLHRGFASRRAAPYSLTFRAYAAADSGRTAAALARVDEMLGLAARGQPSTCPWYLVNAATDIYINSGNYQKAAGAANRWPPEAQAQGREQQPIQYAFTLINRAEALHNLGENDDALQLLRSAEEHSPLPPLGTHGLLLTRSWILTHLGRTAEALGALSSVDPEVLGPRYSAEYFFTRAVSLCAVGDFAAAEAAADDGNRRAKRAASRRNALHIAAGVAVARGNHERAINLLEAARTHAYQGQAAPGLVLLGKCYEVMGQLAQARQSYSDAIVADPESYLCALAKERVGALAEVATK